MDGEHEVSIVLDTAELALYEGSRFREAFVFTARFGPSHVIFLGPFSL